MKKYLIMIMVITSLMVTGLVVYAESDDIEVPEWFTEMLAWRRGEIDKAVQDGSLTAEEAEAWLEHMDEMETYRMEEGFDNYGGGRCGGSGFKDGDSYGGGCGRGNGFRGMTQIFR